jgi:hypothetical protein
MMKTTVYAPSDEVMRKYRELMERPRPPIVRDPKTGARRVALENLERTRVYLLDPDGRCCNCSAGQAGVMCHHRLVVAEWANRDALAAWVDDQDRQQFEAEIERVLGPAPKARATYDSLYPACKGGCGDVSDTRDGYCDRCASDREWQARRDMAGSR